MPLRFWCMIADGEHVHEWLHSVMRFDPLPGTEKTQDKALIIGSQIVVALKFLRNVAPLHMTCNESISDVLDRPCFLSITVVSQNL